MADNKVLENFYRRKAKRLGLGLKKSRSKLINLDDFGEYMLIDLNTNTVVYGVKYDLNLKEVGAWLDEYETNLIAARRAEK